MVRQDFEKKILEIAEIKAGELNERKDEFIHLITTAIDCDLISEITGKGWDTVITLMNGVRITFQSDAITQ